MAFELHPIDASTEAEWDALLREHPMARAIIPKWDELVGWVNISHGLFDSGRLVGGFIVSEQRVPLTMLLLSRINCLLVGPDRPTEGLVATLDYIERLAKTRRHLETEVRLRIPSVTDVEGFESHASLRAAFEADGYRSLSKVDSTYFVRIDKEDDELLASFHSSARRKVRQARKAKATVEISKDTGLLDEFADAYIDMCRRKNVPFLPGNVVGRGLAPLIQAEHAFIFVERYGDKISNMVIVDGLGIPCYVLGSRSRANVAGGVHSHAQIVHFEIMRAMRDRGRAWYDLGGCEGPVPIEAHHNFGVWRFKYGFGGNFVRFMPFMRKIRGPAPNLVELGHVLRGDFV